MRSLTDSWKLGGRTIENRLVLAPLAGIGNWFVRLQARRHGAGLTVSEMVSSFGLAYGNERTQREFLRIDPEEHPVSMQLFGHDADVMREAAGIVAAAGADLIDLNMGCPVRKVCKTGAGAALLDDPDKAVAIAKAAGEGSGLPVTVKLRPGQRPGDRAGVELARRLRDDAGVAGIAFHPRHASQRHKGKPDYALAAELVDALDVPVIVSGGLLSDEKAVEALDRSGAEAVMLARGSLGNPWRFERLLGLRDGRAVRRGGHRRAGVGHRLRRRPPRPRASGPLSAQVLPVVRRTAGPAEGGRGAAGDRPHDHRGARPDTGVHMPDSGLRAVAILPPLMPRETVLTPEGLEDLKAKLETLSTVRRREVAERIKEAREFGDISENSEYDDAKNEQMMLEKQIAEIEERLRSARIIDEGDVSTDVVSVGSTVHVKDQKTDKSVKYRIVGSSEANPSEQKLSNESPVGKALLGHKRGETVKVPVPRGPARQLKITKIEAPSPPGGCEPAPACVIGRLACQAGVTDLFLGTLGSRSPDELR